MEKKVIAPSELIINPDGSVFHLHLLPEQLTDRIILVGDPARVNIVAEHFDTKTFEVSSREFHTIGGTFKGKPIMCLSHGIGPDIDFKTREVKENFRQLSMVRIGTSGALQPELIVGTPVVAEKAIGFDGVLNYYAGRNEIADLEFEKAFTEHTGWNPLWAKPYVVDAHSELVDQIAKDDMVRGNTISAVGFRFGDRKVTNYEMESAPLQGLSRLMGHRAMTVCSIIANRMRHDATPNYKTAIRDLIATVLERI